MSDVEDDIGFSQRDYNSLKDGFLRYLCQTVKEKNRKSFTPYELLPGCGKHGYFGNLDALKIGILESKGIYQTIMDRVMRLLVAEDYLVETDNPTSFAVTRKLRQHCGT